MLLRTQSTHLFVQRSSLGDYEHDDVADSDGEQPASLQHGLHVGRGLGGHKDKRFTTIIILNGMNVSDRRCSTKCTLLSHCEP